MSQSSSAKMVPVVAPASFIADGTSLDTDWVLTCRNDRRHDRDRDEKMIYPGRLDASSAVLNLGRLHRERLPLASGRALTS
jgi:hypothetical protein